jgi:hypothetical protein
VVELCIKVMLERGPVVPRDFGAVQGLLDGIQNHGCRQEWAGSGNSSWWSPAMPKCSMFQKSVFSMILDEGLCLATLGGTMTLGFPSMSGVEDPVLRVSAVGADDITEVPEKDIGQPF